ncbi:MAG TPA: hypothetical protein VF519_12585 [Mycobacteriales bacterium]
MRTKLALAALVAAAASTLAPAPASAICYPALYELTGFCSPCTIAGVPYGIADRATGGTVLPPLYCAA